MNQEWCLCISPPLANDDILRTLFGKSVLLTSIPYMLQPLNDISPFIIPTPLWVALGSHLVGVVAGMGEAVGVVASQEGGCGWSFDQMLPLSLFVHFSSFSSPTFPANLQALVLVELFLNGWLFGYLWLFRKWWKVKSCRRKALPQNKGFNYCYAG